MAADPGTVWDDGDPGGGEEGDSSSAVAPALPGAAASSTFDTTMADRDSRLYSSAESLSRLAGHSSLHDGAGAAEEARSAAGAASKRPSDDSGELHSPTEINSSADELSGRILDTIYGLADAVPRVDDLALAGVIVRLSIASGYSDEAIVALGVSELRSVTDDADATERLKLGITREKAFKDLTQLPRSPPGQGPLNHVQAWQSQVLASRRLRQLSAQGSGGDGPVSGCTRSDSMGGGDGGAPSDSVRKLDLEKDHSASKSVGASPTRTPLIPPSLGDSFAPPSGHISNAVDLLNNAVRSLPAVAHKVAWEVVKECTDVSPSPVLAVLQHMLNARPWLCQGLGSVPGAFKEQLHTRRAAAPVREQDGRDIMFAVLDDMDRQMFPPPPSGPGPSMSEPPQDEPAGKSATESRWQASPGDLALKAQLAEAMAESRRAAAEIAAKDRKIAALEKLERKKSGGKAVSSPPQVELLSSLASPPGAGASSDAGSSVGTRGPTDSTLSLSARATRKAGLKQDSRFVVAVESYDKPGWYKQPSQHHHQSGGAEAAELTEWAVLTSEARTRELAAIQRKCSSREQGATVEQIKDGVNYANSQGVRYAQSRGLLVKRLAQYWLGRRRDGYGVKDAANETISLLKAACSEVAALKHRLDVFSDEQATGRGHDGIARILETIDEVFIKDSSDVEMDWRAQALTDGSIREFLMRIHLDGKRIAQQDRAIKTQFVGQLKARLAIEESNAAAAGVSSTAAADSINMFIDRFINNHESATCEEILHSTSKDSIAKKDLGSAGVDGKTKKRPAGVYTGQSDTGSHVDTALMDQLADLRIAKAQAEAATLVARAEAEAQVAKAKADAVVAAAAFDRPSAFGGKEGGERRPAPGETIRKELGKDGNTVPIVFGIMDIEKVLASNKVRAFDGITCPCKTINPARLKNESSAVCADGLFARDCCFCEKLLTKPGLEVHTFKSWEEKTGKPVGAGNSTFNKAVIVHTQQECRTGWMELWKHVEAHREDLDLITPAESRAAFKEKHAAQLKIALSKL